MAAGTASSVVDSRACDGVVAKTKPSSSAGHQNPALHSSKFNLFTQPLLFERKERSVLFYGSGILLILCMNERCVWSITGMTLTGVNRNTGK
jgi:hypothetical protein